MIIIFIAIGFYRDSNVHSTPAALEAISCCN